MITAGFFIDFPFNAFSTFSNVDINIALDTSFWDGGQLYLGAIDGDYKAAIFSGNTNDVEIETSEIELFPGLRSDITEVRPIVDTTATVAITMATYLTISLAISAFMNWYNKRIAIQEK